MYSSLQYRKERVETMPTLVLLSVRDQYGYRQISVKAFDAKGKAVLEENESPGGFYDPESEGAAKPDAKPPEPETAKIEPSPEAKRFAEIFTRYGPDREKRARPEEYGPFLDVLKRDPLSYGASEALFAYARLKGRSLVVRAQDQLMYLSAAAKELGDKPFDFGILKYFCETTEEGGWLRMGPKDVADARRTFYDRKDLAAALAIAAAPGRATVERKAAMAMATPEDAQQRPAYSMVTAVSGGNEWGREDLLRLYGSLSPAQIAGAKREGGIPFSALGDVSREILRRFVYEGDEWQLQYEPSEAYRERMGERTNEEQNLFYGGYLREPTLAMPSGLPGGGKLRIVADLGDKVKTGPMTRRWGTQPGEILGAQELAQAWFEKENPRRFPWNQGNEWGKKNWDELTLVNQQSVALSLRFDERLTASATLTSDEPVEGGPYTMKTLPERFQESFRKAYAEIEKGYKDQPYPDPGDYGGRRRGGPPPPPGP